MGCQWSKITLSIGVNVSIAGDLRQSIKEEYEAEANYIRRAKTADPITKKLYLHIAHEEHGHALEFKKRLSML